MAPVPDPRELGLQEGSSSHPGSHPHPCPPGWGNAEGFSPSQGWLQHPAWGRGPPALFLQQPIVMGSLGLARRQGDSPAGRLMTAN